MPPVFISVGSNIRPAENVHLALQILNGVVPLESLSTFYATLPLGRPDQPLFYNGVVKGQTELPPRVLKFQVLRGIETQLGRRRTQDQYAPRPIDLDVLLYGDRVEESAGLVLPDPEIAERPFLALPLYELAPDLVLPGSGRSLREIATAFLPHSMQPLLEYTEWLRKEILHGQTEG
jgi:2-amino-4-hydroxy-6-hydroxymethyldihydropteridine diphosphokinase